jgi:hypothetical protein
MVVGKSSFEIPSFTQLPFGAEKFSMILADPFGFWWHIIPLTLADSGLAAGGNGPAANPDATQSATASVTCSLNSSALGALLLTEGERAAPLQPMSAPFSRSLQTLSNKSFLL